MKNITLLLTIISFSTVLFQGCGNHTSTIEETYPTVLGEDVSVITDEKNALMVPSVYALEEAANIVGDVVKEHIIENALHITSETYYCDISGLKTLEKSEVLEASINIQYSACKTENSDQNGEVVLTYTQVDNEANYPTALTIQIEEAYSFNTLTLQKGMLIESQDMIYNEDNSVKELSIKLTGLAEFNMQTLSFEAFEQTITF